MAWRKPDGRTLSERLLAVGEAIRTAESSGADEEQLAELYEIYESIEAHVAAAEARLRAD